MSTGTSILVKSILPGSSGLNVRNGVTTFNDTTLANGSTGSVVLQGGLQIANGTNSSANSGNALHVNGGAVFVGDVYVKGNLSNASSAGTGLTTKYLGTDFSLSLSNLFNISNSSIIAAKYMFSGKETFFFAVVQVTPSSGNALCSFTFALPGRTSNFSTNFDANFLIKTFDNSNTIECTSTGLCNVSSNTITISFNSVDSNVHTIQINIEYQQDTSPNSQTPTINQSSLLPGSILLKVYDNSSSVTNFNVRPLATNAVTSLSLNNYTGPSGQINNLNFRFIGYIKFNSAEVYTFSGSVNSSLRLFVNHTKLVSVNSNGSVKTFTSNTFNVSVANAWHPLLLESSIGSTGAQTLNIVWSSTTTGNNQNIPASNLMYDIGEQSPTIYGTINIDGTLTSNGQTIIGNSSQSGVSANGVFLSLANQNFTDNSTANSSTASSDFSAVYLGVPTLSASNSNVITPTASTLTIAGPPTAGPNESISNTFALNIQGGNSQFGGSIRTPNLPRVQFSGAGTSYISSAVSNTVATSNFTLNSTYSNNYTLLTSQFSMNNQIIFTAFASGLYYMSVALFMQPSANGGVTRLSFISSGVNNNVINDCPYYSTNAYWQNMNAMQQMQAGETMTLSIGVVTGNSVTIVFNSNSSLTFRQLCLT